MADELVDSVRRYTCKHKATITKICAPLKIHLGITYFTYYFIEKDGRFGTISNQPEFIEYYYASNKHLHNPYMSHPDSFCSGYTLAPCAYDPETRADLLEKFEGDHLFMMLKKGVGKVEGFLFATPGLKKSDSSLFINHLDLLNKFSKYFKREAAPLLGNLRADGFNMLTERKEAFLEVVPSLELSSEGNAYNAFLKVIYGLSRQEQRSLELFQQGHSAQATAALMNLSKRTVETYYENIKRKMRMNSKWDLLDL